MAALYQKYRPNKLSEIVGQDDIKITIANSVKTNKLSHAYLFDGIRGTGKCVSPNTIIATENGLLRIGSLPKENINESAEGKTEKINIGIMGQEGKFNRSHYFYFGGKKRIFKITTEAGYQLNCTLNHPIQTFDKEMNFKWKKCSELKVNDVVPISRFKYDFIGNNDISKEKSIADKKFLDYKNGCRFITNIIDVNLPGNMTEDLAYFIGLFIGDGRLDRNSVGICCADYEIEQEVYRISKSIFNTDLVKIKDNRRKSLYSLNLCRKKILFFLESIGVIADGKKNKIIPECIIRSSKKNISSFLAGLYDSDGISDKTEIGLSQDNEDIIVDVQNILSMGFGIISRRRKKYNKKYNKHYFSVSISNVLEIKKFLLEIPIKAKKKFDKNIKYSNAGIDFNRNKDVIYGMSRYINKIKKERSFNNGYILNDDGVKLRVGRISAISFKECTYSRANKFVEYVSKFNKKESIKLKNIIYNNYYFDRIKSIEFVGENFVCDLNIPISNSFISNSFISHNTTLARIMAMIVNCEDGPSVDYDVENSRICRSIINGSCQDVHELDAATNRSINDIREIKSAAYKVPIIARKRVFIIDECHCLDKIAASALLKTLEEPPDTAVFILCTTEIQKIIPTILSRCQHFTLRKLTINQTVDHLKNICDKEGIKSIGESSLSMIAKASQGSMRDAISILDSVIGKCGDTIEDKDVAGIIGTTSQSFFCNLLKHVCDGDFKKSILHIKQATNNGVDPKYIFNGFLEFIHDMMVSKCMAYHKHLYIEDYILENWIQMRDNISQKAFIFIVKKIEEYVNSLSFMPRPDISLDSCIIEIVEGISKISLK